MSMMRILAIPILAFGAVIGPAVAGDSPDVNDSRLARSMSEQLRYRIAKHEAMHRQALDQWIQSERLRRHRVADLALGGLALLNTPNLTNGNGDPVPIPGGLIPGLVHAWLPGPRELGFQGTDVEPNTITHFKGLAGIGYLAGVTSTTSDGNVYEMFHDIRIYRGKYRALDGDTYYGTFVFI